MALKELTNDAMQSSVGKVRQLHVDDGNKAARAGRRIFSDLAMIKAL